ncbi:hypothetical protein [Streptomyces roseoverticillatus]|uniref:Uncharacterized protein n=1 Tax=Streptomyces roseoverticillatus TaxID=66429 RepID=A0ABV3IYE1_9ACTN
MLLAEVAHRLADEEHTAVRTLIGTPQRPAMLAVTMTAERAEQLRREYPDRLVVESDQPLQPYETDSRHEPGSRR